MKKLLMTVGVGLAAGFLFSLPGERFAETLAPAGTAAFQAVGEQWAALPEDMRLSLALFAGVATYMAVALRVTRTTGSNMARARASRDTESAMRNGPGPGDVSGSVVIGALWPVTLPYVVMARAAAKGYFGEARASIERELEQKGAQADQDIKQARAARNA